MIIIGLLSLFELLSKIVNFIFKDFSSSFKISNFGRLLIIHMLFLGQLFLKTS